MCTETQVYLQVQWSSKASEIIMNCGAWWFFHNLLFSVPCSATLDLLRMSEQIGADFTRHSGGIQTSVFIFPSNTSIIIIKSTHKATCFGPIGPSSGLALRTGSFTSSTLWGPKGGMMLQCWVLLFTLRLKPILKYKFVCLRNYVSYKFLCGNVIS